MAERNADTTTADAAPPQAACFCCSGGPARETVPRGIPHHLAPIVAALLTAQTDDEARRTLGLSSRTFSRRVAELLDHLGVATRFQGGVELARRTCRDHRHGDDGCPAPIESRR